MSGAPLFLRGLARALHVAAVCCGDQCLSGISESWRARAAFFLLAGHLPPTASQCAWLLVNLLLGSKWGKQHQGEMEGQQQQVLWGQEPWAPQTHLVPGERDLQPGSPSSPRLAPTSASNPGLFYRTSGESPRVPCWGQGRGTAMGVSLVIVLL